jgi:hypothetical protein
MIANSALLAALFTLFLMAWLAGELQFLAPYKATLFRDHGVHIAVGILLVFVNLHAALYGLARWAFLRDTGRKLTHIDRQIAEGDRRSPGLNADLWTGRR